MRQPQPNQQKKVNQRAPMSSRFSIHSSLKTKKSRSRMSGEMRMDIMIGTTAIQKDKVLYRSNRSINHRRMIMHFKIHQTKKKKSY